MRRTRLFALAAVLASATFAPADDWPQWMGRDRDGVWHETGIVRQLPEGGPKVLWRTPIAGGYSGPAVAAGRVYVCDYVVKEGDTKASPNKRSSIKGNERVLCLDARTGKELWKHEYDCPYDVSYPAGPRCTPTVDGERVYTLGSEGNLVCLRTDSGSVVWAKELKKEYAIKAPHWGFCGHPLVDGDQLVCLVGGDGSVIVSFDKMTGKERWRALSAKEPGYCPPSIIEAGGQRQLIAFTAEEVAGLDPATGKVYWSVPCEPDHGMAIAAPRKSGDYLYAGGMGHKGVMVKLAKDQPKGELAWKAKKNQAAFPSNTTPVVDGDTMYAVDCHEASLRAVSIPDGRVLWETHAPITGKPKVGHGTAFLVKNGDRWFLFSETGHLIVAKLSPEKYEEVSRWKMLEPTGATFGRQYVWSHPAFAEKCVFARNDKEIVCVSLAAE
jgi:outer membrane protein assembly factor BamB